MGAGANRSAQSGEDRPRVLVLIPDSVTREALALALRREVHVECVESGMAGLVLAAKQEVDLVIAEAQLPDVSPDDLLRLLRILRPRLPIAILGAREGPAQAGEDEADVYFSKPVDLRQVIAWILDRVRQRPA